MIIKKYIKKALPVEAIQLTRDVLEDSWKNGTLLFNKLHASIDAINDNTYYLNIPTEEGIMRADEGSWLIKGNPYGELWSVKPEIFAATYKLYEENA